MKPWDQVCSLKLAKKLKELGVEQNSIWYWSNDGDRRDVEFYLVLGIKKAFRESSPKIDDSKTKYYSAFTVAELGKRLPDYTSTWRHPGKIWSCEIADKAFVSGYKSEANARAKMLIYLLENKLIERKGLE